MLKGLLKRISGKNGQGGMSMLEALISVALLGGGVITMVFVMSGGALAVGENEQEATLQNIARSQMEYIKTYPYNVSATTYPAVSAPGGYSISIGVTAVPGTNADIQKVTANISRGGTVLMTLTDYKVNR
jgi:Tfp pilus assembly protein PilV